MPECASRLLHLGEKIVSIVPVKTTAGKKTSEPAMALIYGEMSKQQSGAGTRRHRAALPGATGHPAVLAPAAGLSCKPTQGDLCPKSSSPELKPALSMVGVWRLFVLLLATPRPAAFLPCHSPFPRTPTKTMLLLTERTSANIFNKETSHCSNPCS